jgi:3-phenylpropionate/trans-cinnamate dioxygenase ferredoxin reductase subunit
MDFHDILIVGTGHGGAQAAIALRQRGFEGSMLMVGAETHLPYERPPLSKEYLAGERSFERILIRPADFWASRRVAFRLGSPVTSINADAHVATCADGTTLGYRSLIWAAGGKARRLTCAGAELDGVHSVRNRDDIDRLLAALPGIQRVAIIGGGYIGLEAAAVLSKLGKDVTLIEAQDRVLARVAGEPVSRFLEDEHRGRGVDIRLGVGVESLLGLEGRVRGVVLSDGTELSADCVIVGIGIVPEIEPLRASGAACGDGVEVDAFCQTSLPGVFAIGDCAAHENIHAGGRRIRLECVQNANDQAGVVADFIMGAPRAYDAVPWFWSNQFDLRLQTMGVSTGHDRLVVRGNPADRRFTVVYLRDERIIAVDCMNSPRDYVQSKGLIASRRSSARLNLADPTSPLAPADDVSDLRNLHHAVDR